MSGAGQLVGAVAQGISEGIALERKEAFERALAFLNAYKIPAFMPPGYNPDAPQMGLIVEDKLPPEMIGVWSGILLQMAAKVFDENGYRLDAIPEDKKQNALAILYVIAGELHCCSGGMKRLRQEMLGNVANAFLYKDDPQHPEYLDELGRAQYIQCKDEGFGGFFKSFKQEGQLNKGINKWFEKGDLSFWPGTVEMVGLLMKAEKKEELEEWMVKDIDRRIAKLSQ